MKARRTIFALGAASALLVGVPAVTAQASPTSTRGNGMIATSEFYYTHPASDVVTLSAFHFGYRHIESYQITVRGTTHVVASGSITLHGGAGSTEVSGLGGGQYKVTYSHTDGSTGTVYFKIDCNRAC